MKQKIGWIIGIVSVFLILIGAYFGMAAYYSQRFCYGTWINGVYCTGKSVSEVNEELILLSEYDKITVVDRNENCFEISLSDVDYTIDFSDSLTEIKNNQQWLCWIQYYTKTQDISISPEISFSEEKVTELLMNADFMNSEVYHKDNKTEIVLTEEGYVLQDHRKDQIVPEEVCIAVTNALYDMKSEIDIEEVEGCYLSLPQNAQSREAYRLWKEISEFQDFELTYLFGNREEMIDAGVVSGWISIDEETGDFLRDKDGNFVLDQEKVMEYVVALGEKYDTYGKPREFMATKGELITIEKSTYGNDIDEKKECAQLIDDFLNDRTGIKREPVYAHKAWSQNEKDVEGTYVEVDMTEQKLYYYIDYELVFETDVVTGNMRRGWGTPAVVCSVYGKTRNRILRGATYATFVYYWMPVYGNIGLHDATWRKEFGGDIYQTDGSHGCINLPKAKAAELYEILEINTPVFLFY